MGVRKKNVFPNFLKNGKVHPRNFSTARCRSRVSTRSPSFGGLEFRVWGWGPPKLKIGFFDPDIFKGLKPFFIFLNLTGRGPLSICVILEKSACSNFFYLRSKILGAWHFFEIPHFRCRWNIHFPQTCGG